MFKECLDTNFVSSVGPFVTRFEQSIAAHAGVPFAVATVNGTAALHIALMGWRNQSRRRSPRLNAYVYRACQRDPVRGAFPVFVDAEPEYWEMDVDKAIDFLNNRCSWRDGALYNKSTGRRIRAIVPVHILGHPVDMDRLVEVAHRFNLAIIEDATESLGATYRARPVEALATSRVSASTATSSSRQAVAVPLPAMRCSLAERPLPDYAGQGRCGGVCAR